MPSKKIEDPTLSSLTLGWIVAHAVDPSILKGTGIEALEKFAEKDGADFYEQFVRYVAKSVPSFSEDTGKKLLDPNGRLTQADFKTIKACFEEQSGVRNPWHQKFLGRVVPTIASGPTYIAQILASPAQAIKQVPGINRKLNDDQRIVVENAEVRKEQGQILSRAAIQHYMLPSNVDRYLTMVTVGAAYGEGLPQLWGMADVFGEAKFTDVQMRIDELVERDFSYLRMNLEQQGDRVIVNGKTVGKRVSLKEALKFSPNEDYLERSLAELLSGSVEGIDLRPVLVEEDFICDDELVFPAGNYGMPCTRFELEVPHPGLLSRMGHTMIAAGGRIGDLFRREPEGVYAQLSKLSKHEVIGDLTTGRERADKNAALARAETAEARAETAEARLLEQQAQTEIQRLRDNVSAQSRDLETRMRMQDQNKRQAHHIKGLAVRTIAQSMPLLREYLSSHDEIVSSAGLSMVDVKYSGPKQYGFEDPLLKNLDGLLDETLEMPDDVKKSVDFLLLEREKIEYAMIIMGTYDQSRLENIRVKDYVQKAISSVQGMKRGEVNIINAVPEDVCLRISPSDYELTLTNLIDNAVLASLGGAVAIGAEYDGAHTILEIDQTGPLYAEKAMELNGGVAKSTRLEEGGSGQGSRTSRLFAKENKGSLEYVAHGDDGGTTKLILSTEGPVF